MTIQPLQPPDDEGDLRPLDIEPLNNSAPGFNSSVPFIFGRRRGSRAWKAWHHGTRVMMGLGKPYRLRSISWPVDWEPGDNAFTCMHSGKVSCLNEDPDHTHTLTCPRRRRCPHPNNMCSCGFYAYTDPHQDIRREALIGGPTIVGVVEGWGRMVRASKGFRSEFARIVALTVPDKPSALYTMRHGLDYSDTPTAFQARLTRYVSTAYPDVPMFETEGKMLAAFPLGDVVA